MSFWWFEWIGYSWIQPISASGDVPRWSHRFKKISLNEYTILPTLSRFFFKNYDLIFNKISNLGFMLKKILSIFYKN